MGELSTADRLQGGVVRALTRLPAPAQRALAGGGTVVRDGLELDHECQLVIALAERSGRPAIEELPVAEARAETVKRALT
ncbi:MAG TPA: hypothetical protein VFE45_03160, partial [Coriobacteriia bacterium]|nr:hypothetical protein [Coriobacteriia bacterium]